MKKYDLCIAYGTNPTVLKSVSWNKAKKAIESLYPMFDENDVTGAEELAFLKEAVRDKDVYSVFKRHEYDVGIFICLTSGE